MHFLKYYNDNIVKYDLINKFFCKNIERLPKFNFISLNFNFKKYDLKQLCAALAALEIISEQKGTFIKSKSFNVNLKIKKGYPVGCKVVLRNYKMKQFLEKLLNKIFIKNKKYNVSRKLNSSLSFTIKNILIFSELEKNYQFFKTLKNLNVTIMTTTNNLKLFKFLLFSYKIKI